MKKIFISSKRTTWRISIKNLRKTRVLFSVWKIEKPPEGSNQIQTLNPKKVGLSSVKGFQKPQLRCELLSGGRSYFFKKGRNNLYNRTGALTIFCPLMIQGLIPDTVSIFMFLYIPSNSAALSWHCWVDRKLYLVN